jgi:hypothetical protein
MSKIFYLFVREIHMQRYRIAAETPQEALEKFNTTDNGECIGDTEYSHIDSVAYIENEDGEEVLSSAEIEEDELDPDICPECGKRWDDGGHAGCEGEKS